MTEEDLLSYDQYLPDSQEDRVEVLELLGFDCHPNNDGSIHAVIGDLHIYISNHSLSMTDIFYNISKAHINEEW